MTIDMDKDFQDRIDEYILHGDKMSEEDKLQFQKEIEESAEKREQYEFTMNLRKALVSRCEKLKAMAEFQKDMETRNGRPTEACDAAPYSERESEEKKHKHSKAWLWLSGIAAILVTGFLAITPSFVGDTPNDNVRGDEDDVFDKMMPTDSLKSDSIAADSVIPFHE